MSRNAATELLDHAITPPPRRIEGEFWTSKQRQASSLHEISYRACFKPQLARHFIEEHSNEGDVVYDPFMGRGTTPLEAALLKRNVIGNDINPLCRILAEPRLDLPAIAEVQRRLEEIGFSKNEKADIDLSMFYHRDTEAEIVSLQKYLARRKEEGDEDSIDRWIRMVATNRLTGHSVVFFSVYTLPPNQAALPANQRRINRLRKQKPEYRDVRKIILKKTSTLLKRVSEDDRRNLSTARRRAEFFSSDARETPQIQSESVHLTVTSPPFLDVVQYPQDNWLRCWFNGIDARAISGGITMLKSIDEWKRMISKVLTELFRVTRFGGVVAFEVGEVRKGSVKLEDSVVPLGEQAGFKCEAVLINLQRFTKTANIWGIDNNLSGTNTNRIVLFKK